MPRTMLVALWLRDTIFKQGSRNKNRLLQLEAHHVHARSRRFALRERLGRRRGKRPLHVRVHVQHDDAIRHADLIVERTAHGVEGGIHDDVGTLEVVPQRGVARIGGRAR